MAQAEQRLSTPQEVEVKYGLAKEVMGSLQRAVRTHVLYPPDHQMHIHSTDDLVARFLAFFEKYTYMRLEVKPDRLDFDKKLIVQAEPRESEIPFRLYKDGIRELRFHRGLTREEILDFTSLLELEPAEIAEMGEDMVSLIWTKDFRSIDYAAIDEFEPGTNEGWVGLDPTQAEEAREIGKSIDRITARLQSVRRMAADMPAREEPVRARAAAPVAIPEEQVTEAFTRPLQEPAERMRAEVENETLGGAIRKSLEILVKLFEGRERGQAREVGPLLRGVVGFYLRRLDFASLGHLMAKIRESGLLTGVPDGDQLYNEMVEQIRKAATGPAVFGHLSRGLNDDFEGLDKFFKMLGPAGVNPVASIYGRVAAAPLRAELRKYLVASGVAVAGPMCRELLRTAEKYLDEVFVVIGAVRPSAVHEELQPYLKNPNARVRILALSAAARAEGAHRARTLAMALEDADPKVRSEALKLMAHSREAGLRVPLEQWVGDRAFIAREAWEKEAALRALGACGGALGLTLLRKIAEQKPPLLNKAKHEETRRAAVLAIGDLGTPPGRAWLQQQVAGNTDVKRFAEEALARRPAP